MPRGQVNDCAFRRSASRFLRVICSENRNAGFRDHAQPEARLTAFVQELAGIQIPGR
jgi:hypothetical protein